MITINFLTLNDLIDFEMCFVFPWFLQRVLRTVNERASERCWSRCHLCAIIRIIWIGICGTMCTKIGHFIPNKIDNVLKGKQNKFRWHTYKSHDISYKWFFFSFFSFVFVFRFVIYLCIPICGFFLLPIYIFFFFRLLLRIKSLLNISAFFLCIVNWINRRKPENLTPPLSSDGGSSTSGQSPTSTHNGSPPPAVKRPPLLNSDKYSSSNDGPTSKKQRISHYRKDIANHQDTNIGARSKYHDL